MGLIATSPAPSEIRIAFAATATAWLMTAAVAVAAVLKRRLSTLRSWMLRNYLVTLAPVTFRLLLPAASSLGLTPSPELIAIRLWASWSLPLLIFEVVQRVSRARPVKRALAHGNAR